MSGNLAETPALGIGRLLFEHRFLVPNHQRDYSWTDEHAREFIDDITNAMDNEESAYFVGLMVFMRSNTGHLIVLDGQQRLATTLMIISVIRNWLNQFTDHKEDASNIQMQFIGRSELGERTLQPRLSLNSANNNMFERYVIKSVAISEVTLGLNGLKRHDRNRNMLEVFRYLDSRIADIAGSNPDHTAAAAYMIRLIKYLRDNVSVVSLDVQTEGTAYTIFESLNDRGMELSPLDLVKNHLFSRADSKEGTRLRDMEARWAQMMATLANVKRDAFLKAFWTARFGRIRTPQLFNTIKKSSANAQQAIALSIDMLEGAEHYAGLENSNDILWSRCSHKTRASIDNLKIIGSQQSHPMLLAGIKQLALSELERLVRLIEVLTVRYVLIVGGNTGRFETTCAITARMITNKELRTASEIFAAMRDVYPNDEDFRNSFSVKQERSGPKIQYVLKALEDEERRICEGKSAQEIALPDGLTVEHILPKNPSAEWENITKADPLLTDDGFCDRLGNLCLLSDVNRSLGRKSFPDKRPFYQASLLKTTKAVGNEEIWNRKAIEHRQTHMAKRAVSIWRFQ